VNILKKSSIYFDEYLYRVGKMVLLIFLLVLGIKFFILDISSVSGVSMAPTFLDNQKVLVSKWELLLQKPDRYDVVQIVAPDNDDLIIKRVIGLPGEKIRTYNGYVYLVKDGEEQVLDEPYINEELKAGAREFDVKEFEMGENEYLVLGDNRPVSDDSRSFGPVHRKRILGKVF